MISAVQRSMTTRIYTRTGDKGTSSLYNGERRSKDDAVFHALGSTDELNSNIGVAREHVRQLHQEDLSDRLARVQARLLDVGSCIATPPGSNQSKIARTAFPSHEIDQVEKWIDETEATLPPLKNFILPSGGLAASHLHVCRSVCRRAERDVVPLVREEQVDAAVGIYLNRLSDFFFVAARKMAAVQGATETIYSKSQ